MIDLNHAHAAPARILDWVDMDAASYTYVQCVELCQHWDDVACTLDTKHCNTSYCELAVLHLIDVLI